MLTVGGIDCIDSARCFIYDVVFQAISERKLCGKDGYVLFDRHFCMKIIVTLIPIGLVMSWFSSFLCSSV